MTPDPKEPDRPRTRRTVVIFLDGGDGRFIGEEVASDAGSSSGFDGGRGAKKVGKGGSGRSAWAAFGRGFVGTASARVLVEAVGEGGRWGLDRGWERWGRGRGQGWNGRRDGASTTASSRDVNWRARGTHVGSVGVGIIVGVHGEMDSMRARNE